MNALQQRSVPPLVSDPYGGAVGSGTALQAGRSRVIFEIFHWHKPSGRNMAVESTQPQTEMTTSKYFL